MPGTLPNRSIPIELQKKELRLKEALLSAQGHTAKKVIEMAFKPSP